MAVNEPNINGRMYFVVFTLLVMAAAIFFKMSNIQFKEGSYYKKLAEERTVKKFVIPANRGNIYASDGSLLATSIPHYTIRFDALAPSKETFDALVRPLSDSLSIMFGKPSSHYLQMLTKARNTKNRYLLIARNLNYSQHQRVKTFPLFSLGVYKGGLITEQKTVRELPMGGVSERTIGYERLGHDGYYYGKGLEWAFSDFLRGRDGQRLMQKMAKGQWKPIRDENEMEPQDGFDVISTINVYIQDIAHHALLKQLQKYEADRGCVVVMETKTGAIRAISNLKRTKNGTYYEAENYAINEAHEPGSTFKVIDLLALLEEKLVDTSTVFDSKGGEIIIHNRRVRDSRKGGYGQISLAKAFEVSSNTVLVQAVYDNYKNRPQDFVNYIKRLHLHQPLGLQIKGEGRPIIPEPGQKNWYGTTLPWMAYGYGVAVTPLQTLTLYNAIANNGVMVKPQFVSEVRDWQKTIKRYEPEVINPKIASDETLSKVQAVLENVVKNGTGKKLYSPDFSMAGKTGTAQVGYTDKANMSYTSSFVGYFPADEPKYSCIVIVHKPASHIGYYGADVAGPVFKRVAQKVFTDVPSTDVLDESPKVSPLIAQNYEKYDKILHSAEKYLPSVVGMPVMDAIALLENLNLRVQIQGNAFGVVKQQSVEPGSILQKNKIIVLKAS